MQAALGVGRPGCAGDALTYAAAQRQHAANELHHAHDHPFQRAEGDPPPIDQRRLVLGQAQHVIVARREGAHALVPEAIASPGDLLDQPRRQPHQWQKAASARPRNSHSSLSPTSSVV